MILQTLILEVNDIMQLTVLITSILLIFGLFHFEGFYVEYIRQKPLFRHLYLWLKRLTNHQRHILSTAFAFYKRLPDKEKAYFEHRVAKFISRHQFISKDDAEITDEVKILVAATAIKLTFGYRHYDIHTVDKFLIYPEEFYSSINEAYHKGEFNPGYRSIALSWKDFLEGYDIDDDNFNLGVHEYVHAMHFSFLKNSRDVSATIFNKGFEKLKKLLDNDESYKQRLIKSEYLRDYAYSNQFEFLSVMIESFIETPEAFRAQFPEMYRDVRAMLNFNFAGY